MSNGFVMFGGEPFAVAERVGLMPLMRFAKVAQSGVDTDDMAGLVAMYDLIEQCIAPADWTRFQAAADRSRADGDMLMEVVTEALAVITARPTSRPSASSDGPQTTGMSSMPSSSDPEPLYASRPDLQLILMRADQAQAAQAS